LKEGEPIFARRAAWLRLFQQTTRAAKAQTNSEVIPYKFMGVNFVAQNTNEAIFAARLRLLPLRSC
jgi:hypothetical protein